jgi:hypothetical protein
VAHFGPLKQSPRISIAFLFSFSVIPGTLRIFFFFFFHFSNPSGIPDSFAGKPKLRFLTSFVSFVTRCEFSACYGHSDGVPGCHDSPG